MRKENSIKNSISSIFSNIITMVISFVAQAIFIKTLGTEYLGLNGLFTNILTILSFFELGIGSAIVFHLYKPISDNDQEKIKGLMNFYKKAYKIISILVFACGLLFIPFLRKIVGEVKVDINIYYIYLMYLINTSSSYLLSYRKNIIQANQKGYILNYVHIAYVILLNIFQMTLLFLFHNYYIYLFLKFIFQLLENAIDSLIASRMYPFLNDIKDYKIDKKTEKDIFKKVKAMVYHQVGSSIVNGTDNIIISAFLGVYYVGLYSNYYIIINAVNLLCKQLINGTTASVGDLLVSSNDNEKKYKVFDQLRFINFIISFVCGICILNLMEPFISIWIGKEFLLSSFVLFTLVFNFFQKTQRCVYQTFKNSGGIWYEDRYIPIIESIINIVVSIVLLKTFGLVGVFLGTIISGLLLWLYSYPKYIYKNLFKRSYKNYFVETFRYIIIFVVGAMSTYFVSKMISVDNLYVKLIINSTISVSVSIIFIFAIFWNDYKLKSFLEMLNKIFCKFIKRRKNDRKNI